MGFKKLCLTAGLAVLGSLCFAPGALAWTFSASGSATCDRNAGEHVIIWSIDNRTEPETLTIRESGRASVAVGSTVAARSVRQFAERLAGSTTGTVTLTVKGNWPSDRYLRTRSASVTLSSTCLRDLCPNLQGVQEQIPSGLIKDAAGNCVPPPPTDVCPNLQGVQEQIPSGLIKDAAGNCVPPPPTDICPNIEGVQTSLPEHFVLEDGKCVCPPHETVVEKIVENKVEVQVPGPERIVTVASAPQVVEKVVERVVTKTVFKRVKVKAKKKVKRVKRTRALRPRVLPFTP
jgi:hypothetical protein